MEFSSLDQELKVIPSAPQDLPAWARIFFAAEITALSGDGQQKRTRCELFGRETSLVGDKFSPQSRCPTSQRLGTLGRGMRWVSEVAELQHPHRDHGEDSRQAKMVFGIVPLSGFQRVTLFQSPMPLFNHPAPLVVTFAVMKIPPQQKKTALVLTQKPSVANRIVVRMRMAIPGLQMLLTQTAQTVAARCRRRPRRLRHLDYSEPEMQS